MSKATVSRRKFLTTLGVGTAAAAAAVAARQGSDAKQAPAADKKQGKGYQLTEHVKNYYRTAKV
jgi:anaerobic selenocysteine-containing dehydrogenase